MTELMATIVLAVTLLSERDANLQVRNQIENHLLEIIFKIVLTTN